MNRYQYLQRLNYTGTLQPNLTTLKALQEAHLLTIPFENLSIHAQQPIQLDEASLFQKIIVNCRGGFCYELNGLFAALLRDLGFQVAFLGAGVAKDNGDFSPIFDHMALHVKLDSAYLVDVGFGDFCIQPLNLNTQLAQEDASGCYRVQQTEEFHVIQKQTATGEWQACYRFPMTFFQPEEFEPRCRYHQTSAESTFTQKIVCSRRTPNGRVSLTANKFITTIGSEREELAIGDSVSWAHLLVKWFSMPMPTTLDLEGLKRQA